MDGKMDRQTLEEVPTGMELVSKPVPDSLGVLLCPSCCVYQCGFIAALFIFHCIWDKYHTWFCYFFILFGTAHRTCAEKDNYPYKLIVHHYDTVL